MEEIRMTPIRCGCIVESEEEYDALRRESKRSVSISCFAFEICMLMFLIASIVISAVIGDSDEAFLVFYIMYINSRRDFSCAYFGHSFQRV